MAISTDHAQYIIPIEDGYYDLKIDDDRRNKGLFIVGKCLADKDNILFKDDYSIIGSIEISRHDTRDTLLQSDLVYSEECRPFALIIMITNDI